MWSSIRHCATYYFLDYYRKTKSIMFDDSQVAPVPSHANTDCAGTLFKSEMHFPFSQLQHQLCESAMLCHNAMTTPKQKCNMWWWTLDSEVLQAKKSFFNVGRWWVMPVFKWKEGAWKFTKMPVFKWKEVHVIHKNAQRQVGPVLHPRHQHKCAVTNNLCLNVEKDQGHFAMLLGIWCSWGHERAELCFCAAQNWQCFWFETLAHPMILHR